MTEFLSMGGYAEFVWPAFGVAALVLTWLVISSLRSVSLNQKILADLEARVPGRRPRNRKDTSGDGAR
ncbi:MAG: heme exporter protein CcmD [Rhodospirillales bacterium]|nr:heme exporter protein CcmD [Rhodospirillales bacterium]